MSLPEQRHDEAQLMHRHAWRNDEGNAGRRCSRCGCRQVWSHDLRRWLYVANLLTVTFDVTGLSQDEVDQLAGEVQAQAEATDPDPEFGNPGHPEVMVVAVAQHDREEAR